MKVTKDSSLTVLDSPSKSKISTKISQSILENEFDLNRKYLTFTVNLIFNHF
jgi:hypothetical protein